MSKFSTESIALGATLIAQAKGEITAARHAAQGAVGWLRAIDPTYKQPASNDAIAPDVDPIDGDIRRPANPAVSSDAIAAAESRAADALGMVANLTTTIEEIRAAIPPAVLTRADGDIVMAVTLLTALADRASRQGSAPAPAQAPTPAVVKPIPPPPGKAQAPAQAQAQVPAPTVVKPIPPVSDGAVFDPTIHVPAEARGNATAVAFYRSQWERGWRPKP